MYLLEELFYPSHHFILLYLYSVMIIVSLIFFIHMQLYYINKSTDADLSLIMRYVSVTIFKQTTLAI